MTIETKPRKDSLVYFIGTGILILGGLYLALVASRVFYPFNAGSLEAFNWMSAAHLLEGKNPYSYSLTPPYSMLPYGIVFYIMTAFGVEIFGFQMWFVRVLTVLAFCFCLFSVFKITKIASSYKETAAVAVLAGLAMFSAQSWIATMRPDLIAAAFALAALCAVFTIKEDQKIGVFRLAALILPASAAFFTKQPYLLATGIVFLRLLQLKKWREGVLFALLFSALAVAVMFFLNQTSDGGYFWQHFTHASRLPYDWSSAFGVFSVMLKQPTFFLSLTLFLVYVYRKRDFFSNLDRSKLEVILRSPKTLLVFYALLTTATSFLLSGRQGGNVNYYLENSFALAVLCGLIYDDLRRADWRKWALALIILLPLGGTFQLTRVLRGEYFRWQSLNYYREVFAAADKFISPGSVCVSVSPELVVWNGCAFNFDDFEEYNGGWSPELREIFEREVRQNRYAVIIWFDDDFQSTFPNYRLVPMSQPPPQNFFPVYLYVPEQPKN